MDERLIVGIMIVMLAIAGTSLLMELPGQTFAQKPDAQLLAGGTATEVVGIPEVGVPLSTATANSPRAPAATRAAAEPAPTRSGTVVARSFPTAVTPRLTPTPVPPFATTVAPNPLSAPQQDSPSLPVMSEVSAVDLIQRVAAAETTLRTARLEAQVDYGDGAGASATIVADLGGEGRPARLHFIARRSAGGAQTSELIMVGERAWQRGPDQQWVAASGVEGTSGQLKAFLPRASAAVDPRVEDEDDRSVLRWTDPARSEEVTLWFDPATGTPLDLRRIDSGGAILRVTYHDWNGPVDIAAPAEG
jgi:hypothetical protein